MTTNPWHSPLPTPMETKHSCPTLPKVLTKLASLPQQGTCTCTSPVIVVHCTSPVIVVLSYKHCEALLISLVLVYMYTTLRTCTFNTGLLDTLFSLCYTYMYVLLLFCTMSCTCACRMVEKSLLLGIPSMTSGMASTRSKRILRELRHYQNDPHPSIEVYPNEDKYRLQLVHPQYM